MPINDVQPPPLIHSLQVACCFDKWDGDSDILILTNVYLS